VPELVELAYVLNLLRLLHIQRFQLSGGAFSGARSEVSADSGPVHVCPQGMSRGMEDE
jgi:hypothetical protein